jgi:tRNA G18 (ribose-2'-O)-methylase SpoU
MPAAVRPGGACGLVARRMATIGGMDVAEIEDPADPRVAEYMALTDVALRRRFEPPHGLFIAEGELVIRRAARAGYRLRSLLASPKMLAAAPDLATVAGGAPVYVASPQVLHALTGFNVHRGALASVARRSLPAAAEVVATASRIVVLEDVNSHTNLGAVFRCASGLGMDAVLLSPGCADPLYRRSVRVSMGEVLSMPYARLEAWPDGLQALADAGFTLLALTPDPAAEPLDRVAGSVRGRVAVLIGAEGPGLSRHALATAHRRVRIPMARGVDSLNVAAAAAVAFWALGARGE